MEGRARRQRRLARQLAICVIRGWKIGLNAIDPRRFGGVSGGMTGTAGTCIVSTAHTKKSGFVGLLCAARYCMGINESNKVCQVRLDDQRHCELKRWSRRSGIAIARLVRRLLLLLPYSSLTNTDLIVLKVPAHIRDDPTSLDQFLEEACNEIREHYGRS